VKSLTDATKSKDATLSPEKKRNEMYTDVLKETLKSIEENDTNYEVRYGLVLRALLFAHDLGFETGIRIDEAQPEWPVVYIELPTGQVSWHMPQHNVEWDGHDSKKKYLRIYEWVRSRKG
jgi:hypothetical protein